ISREDRWETDKNNHKTQTNNKRALKRKKSAPKPPNKKQNISETGERPIPYNVMMLANDKQKQNKLQQKKRVIQKDHRDVQQKKYNLPIDLLNEPTTKSKANHLEIKEQQQLKDQK